MNLRSPFTAALGLAALLSVAAPVRGAESYDNCTGTIEALPAVISSPGTWCLKKNLSTAIASGTAITIATGSVVLDCNDFRISGLAAGLATNTVGIAATYKDHVTIRHCGVRGFHIGIRLAGDTSTGGLVEDNLLESNTDEGIELSGVGHVVRRNRVFDTGGRPGASQIEAMYVNSDQGSVTDNLVSGVTVGGVGFVYGLIVNGRGNEISRNQVVGLAPPESGQAWGIAVNAAPNVLRDNSVLNLAPTPGAGINADAAAVCSGNRVSHFAGGINGCTDAGGNVAN